MAGQEVIAHLPVVMLFEASSCWMEEVLFVAVVG